jgi:hypothetical protein
MAYVTLDRPLFTPQCRSALQTFLSTQPGIGNGAECAPILANVLNSDVALGSCTDGGFCLRAGKFALIRLKFRQQSIVPSPRLY